jgi:hypothetical protein
MLRRLLLALLLLMSALPALAGPKSTKAKRVPPVGAKAPRDALTAAADEIARQVAALRGLQLSAPLQRGVLSRDEIGAKLKERIAKEYTPDEVKVEARVLKRLGLLPPDVDYEKLILELLMEQVAGFYDPFVTRLYIADWLPLELQRPAMAHEIEHALQDQHFDLKKFAQPLKDEGDRQLARMCLVEGDGTAVMLEFQAQAMGLPVDQLPNLVEQLGKQMMAGGFGNTPQFDRAPQVVKETLIFPYLGGLKFVESIRKSAPWTKVDEVFKNPPESTKQILHPEKYWAQDHPVKIVPAPLPSMGARKEVRRDVLGELELKVLFAAAPPPPTPSKPSKTPAPPPSLDPGEEAAMIAAAGWSGDREVAYADPALPDAPPVVVDLSVWESEGDAKEAEAAARRVMAKLSGKSEPTTAGATARYADGAGEEWSVTRDHDKLLMIFGTPAGTTASVVDETLKGWKIGR